jgi:hypothetical protein
VTSQLCKIKSSSHHILTTCLINHPAHGLPDGSMTAVNGKNFEALPGQEPRIIPLTATKI